ncbi:MAG TPA: extensin family protein [Hyphomicrobiaceae bacterium]|nr:extensin family protein [Hyphomicrobiaceae bacterium]
MSTRLSIAAVLGLTLFTLLPAGNFAPSLAAVRAAANKPAPAPLTTASAPPAHKAVPPTPIDIVRAKPVPLVSPAEPAAQPPASESVQVAARRRHRHRQPEPTEPAAAKPSPDDKSAPVMKDAAKQEPAPPGKDEKTPDVQQAAEAPKPDVWSDAEVIAALRQCVRLLAPISAKIEVSEPLKHEECGDPAPVVLRSIDKVELQPPAVVNCAMAASLYHWVEDTLQPTAQDVLGTHITRLRNLSGYACRNRNGSLHGADKLSEHARANAIDIASFVTADGRTVDVSHDWGPTKREEREAAKIAAEQARQQKERAKEEAAASKGKGKDEKAKTHVASRTDSGVGVSAADRRRFKIAARAPIDTTELRRLGKGAPKAEAAAERKGAIPVPAAPSKPAKVTEEGVFLHRLHKGACGTFGTVLGPEANAAHSNHLHFDLAPRRHKAFCE